MKAAGLPDADFQWTVVSNRKQTVVGPKAGERAGTSIGSLARSRRTLLPESEAESGSPAARTIPGDKSFRRLVKTGCACA